MEDVPTRAVVLAYPLELDGTTHEAGATVDLRADQGNERYGTPNARQLVRDGRARYADEGEQVEESSPPPPRSGTGSGRDAWAAWAQQRNFPVTEDMTRDDIIAAVSPSDSTSTDSASGADTTSTTGTSTKAG